MYEMGAESRVVTRNLQIGEEGGYLVSKRARGKDILISPLFFSENADVFTDLAAKAGASKIQKLLGLIKKAQGLPLSVIEKRLEINGERISSDDLRLIKRLAQDGAVKPPSITTEHAGNNIFIFTPAPGVSKLDPSNREIYERSMALISSVRQGQYLSRKYPILWPDKILQSLKRNGYLKDTSETYSQYHQLAVMKVGTLQQVTGNRYRFMLIETDENRRALNLAISLLETGNVSDMEGSEEAKIALQKDQTYIESIIASSKLRSSETINLDEESREEIDNLFIKGVS